MPGATSRVIFNDAGQQIWQKPHAIIPLGAVKRICSIKIVVKIPYLTPKNKGLRMEWSRNTW